MKNILLSFLMCMCLVVNASAEDGITLGYCNGQISRQSSISVEGEAWVSASMLLTAEMLAPYVGNDISSVRAGLAARTNVDNLCVWIRRTLTGENLAVSEISIDDSEIVRGWNELSFSSPYQIKSGEQLYIGMSYKQRDTSNALSVITGTQANSFFFQPSEGAEWQDRSNDGILSIEAVITGDNLTQYDLELLSAEATYNANGDIDVAALVHNAGTKGVSGFTISSVVGNGIETLTNDINVAIEKGGSTAIIFTISPTTASVGRQHKLSIEISSLAEGVDENTENNKMFVVFAYPRKVLIEEFTGESCTNCPRAAKNLHEVMAQGDFANNTVMAAHHSGYYPDWLTFEPSDLDYEWFYNHDIVYFAPAMMFDRMAYPATYNSVEYYTPCVNTSNKEIIETSIINALYRPARAFLDVTAALYDDNTKIRVSVEGGRSTEFSATPARLTVFIVEDHIEQRHQVSMDTYPEYEHMGVLRAVNTSWGDVISWENDLFNATYDFTIDEDWEIENLRIIAFISAYDENDATVCQVENTNQVSIADVLTSINPATAAKTLASQKIFTLDGKPVNSKTEHGLYIMCNTYTDGSTIVQKEIR